MRYRLLFIAFVVVAGLGAATAWRWWSQMPAADLAEAKRAIGHKEFPAADAAAERMLTRDPGNGDALEIRARVAIVRDRLDDASALLARVADPGEDVLALTAQVEVKRHEPARAAAALRELDKLGVVADHLAAFERAWDRRAYFDLLREAATPDTATINAALSRTLVRYGRNDEAARVDPSVANSLRISVATAPPARQDPENKWLAARVALRNGDIAGFQRISGELDRSGAVLAKTRNEPAPLVGSANCAECHRNRVVEQAKTAHARTTTLIAGVPPERKTMPAGTADPNATFFTHRIEKTVAGSTAIATNDGSDAMRLALWLGLGSGRHGITYLGAEPDGAIREYRLSHFGHDGWDLTIGHEHSQEIGIKKESIDLWECLRCHNTDLLAALSTAPQAATEDSSAKRPVELGVRCESCHGPGAHHSQLARAKSLTPDPAIRTPSRLDKFQQVALCAGCHQPPGTQLTPRSKTAPRFPSIGFAASKCFTQSATFTCTSCHDPHVPERKTFAAYDAVCLKCHRTVAKLSCPPTPPTQTAPRSCVGCHMPLVPGISRHSAFADHYISRRPGG